jgi:hypothetical protein
LVSRYAAQPWLAVEQFATIAVSLCAIMGGPDVAKDGWRWGRKKPP